MVLAYARRIGTSPSLPSRLVQRLEAYAGAAAATAMRGRGDVLAGRGAGARRRGGASRRRPGPCRPRRRACGRVRSSVTEIEKLIRSPYELYARYVLGLKPLDPLGADADLAERGSLIHEVIARFSPREPIRPIPQALDLSSGRGRCAFSPGSKPSRRAGPSGAAAEGAGTQGARIRGRTGTAISPRAMSRWIGHWRFPSRRREVRTARPGRPHRPARRRQLRDHRLQDRRVPKAKEMKALLAPQLLVEAAMLAEQVASTVLAAGPVSALTYLKLPADPTGFENKAFALPDGMDLAAAVEALTRALQRRIGQFLLRDDLPIGARHPAQADRTYEGDYDHLSRRAEWAAADDAEEGGMNERPVAPNPDIEPQAGRSRRSAQLGLGVGQCRLGQDPCADRARAAAAADRRVAGRNPLPHLHQGGGGRDARPRHRTARAWALCAEAELDEALAA